MTLLLALSHAAWAIRPTSGGMYAFDDADVVESWEEPTGTVRVHYSVDGPNVVKSGDTDTDGVPDFAADVAITAADVLVEFELLGFRPPISEADLDLGELGGSPAFDFYLVDFGGDADGYFGVDDCTNTPHHCAGFMVMENDFRGYGYPNLHEAVKVLTSHELFHGVQSAYDAGQASWLSEGTAVWAERAYDPTVDDFAWFAQAYLDDSGRSLDRPPTGPVPSFSYGTGIFWEFLSTRHDDSAIVALLEATEADPEAPLVGLDALLADRGDTLRDAWIDFVSWNLATGDRAGATSEAYAYAGSLDGVTATAEGAGIDDDNRFYPLAATYYRVDHAGGELWFGVEEPTPELHFRVHPVEGGADDGPVGDAVADFDADVSGSLGDLPAGGYWVVGTYPEIASESTKRRVCFGDQAFVETCFPPPVDTGEEEPGGCACDHRGAAPWGPGLLLVAALLRRYRRAR